MLHSCFSEAESVESCVLNVSAQIGETAALRSQIVTLKEETHITSRRVGFST